MVVYGLVIPIILWPKKYWHITSSDIRKGEIAAENKKYLKFIISNSLKRYTINNTKKNLKKNIDFIKFIELIFIYSSKIKDCIKFKLVEKIIKINNKKIIFNEKFNFVFKILDRNWKIPKQQNNNTFRFIIKFPKIKLIGKNAKTKFINLDDTIKFFLIRLLE